MSMLKVPKGLTKRQTALVKKSSKGAKRGQKKSKKRLSLTGKAPVPSRKIPKGMSRKRG